MTGAEMLFVPFFALVIVATSHFIAWGIGTFAGHNFRWTCGVVGLGTTAFAYAALKQQDFYSMAVFIVVAVLYLFALGYVWSKIQSGEKQKEE